MTDKKLPLFTSNIMFSIEDIKRYIINCNIVVDIIIAYNTISQQLTLDLLKLTKIGSLKALCIMQNSHARLCKIVAENVPIDTFPSNPPFIRILPINRLLTRWLPAPGFLLDGRAEVLTQHVSKQQQEKTEF